MTLLDVSNLSVSFRQDGRVVQAVRGVSFSVAAGETVALVGESGSGKSVTALSTVGLLPDSADIDGSVTFGGAQMIGARAAELRRVRGNEVSFIFQEPMTSLNPVYTIGNQLMESVLLHQNLSGGAARRKAVEMLKLVGIPRADEVMDEYPHRFSGGMRQRAMIAMALSCNPKLLIADEPTTALDVTIQAQILELMHELRERIGMAILFITHDLGVIAEMVDKVVVMYAGKVVEQAEVVTLFHTPQHPYTRGLIGSRPAIEQQTERLAYIPGNVPNPLHMPGGCPFHPRCDAAMEICTTGMPPHREMAEGQIVRCWLHEERTEKQSRRLHAREVQA